MIKLTRVIRTKKNAAVQATKPQKQLGEIFIFILINLYLNSNDFLNKNNNNNNNFIINNDNHHHHHHHNNKKMKIRGKK